MRDAVFALIWSVMFPISLWSAHVGVLLWVWVALLAPGEQLYSVMSGLPYNKVVAISTLAVLMLNRERKDFYADTAMVLMVLLGIAGTFSAVFSISDGPLNWDLYGKLLKILVLAFVIGGVMWSRHRLHLLLVVICLGYGFEALSEGGQFLLTAGGHKVLGASSVGDNNQLAVALLMIVPMLYYLMRYSDVRLVRLAFLGTMIFSLFAVMGTYSRGGAIGIVVLAIMFLKNSTHKLRGAIIIAVLGALIVVAAPDSWKDRLNTLNNTGEDSSFMQRVTVWKISTLIALDRPLIGGGFHAVQTWPAWLEYGRRLPFLEFINTPPPEPTPRAAHSTYFEVLGDLGFTGFFLFMSLLAVAFLNLSRVRRIARDHPNLVWAADMAQMLQITLAVFMVTTAALSMGYFECLYICVALSSRLLRTVRQTAAGTLPMSQPARTLVALPAPGLQPVSRTAA